MEELRAYCGHTIVVSVVARLHPISTNADCQCRSRVTLGFLSRRGIAVGMGSALRILGDAGQNAGCDGILRRLLHRGFGGSMTGRLVFSPPSLSQGGSPVVGRDYMFTCGTSSCATCFLPQFHLHFNAPCSFGCFFFVAIPFQYATTPSPIQFRPAFPRGNG